MGEVRSLDFSSDEEELGNHDNHHAHNDHQYEHHEHWADEGREIIDLHLLQVPVLTGSRDKRRPIGWFQLWAVIGMI